MGKAHEEWVVSKVIYAECILAFVAAFGAALAANKLTTLVAKVEAKGPPVFLTDLPMLENRFQFARYLKNVKG